MKVDRRLLPMKVHYFLRFMGTGPLTVFLPVIARQMGMPAKVVGYVWAILPFVSLVAKTSAGAIADMMQGHRAVFLGGLLLMVTSLTALYWVPDIPPPHNSTSIVLPNTKASTPPPSSFAAMTTSASTLYSYSALHSNLSALPLLSSLASVTSFSPPPVEGEDEGGFFQGTGTDSDDPPPSFTPAPRLSEEGGGARLVGHYEFWVLFVCLLGQYCGHVIVITMQETVCFQLLGEERHKYGQQRVWGTIGIGLSAIISGALVDLYSKGLGRRDYMPAHVLTAVFLVVDIFLVARLKFPLPERNMSSSSVLQGALWRPHVVLVLASTAVAGVMSGLLWTFEFLLVEDVVREWQPQFRHLRLLLGLLTGVQCFLAEAPFFMLAGRIIQRLGHANALFVSLLGFTLRLVLYSFVSNPWCFLLVDLLHGISFAVAYHCFTSYASTVAPKGAAATTQAIFGATFFGSTGVGGLVGGWLFAAVGGRQTFLWMGVATGVYSVLFLAAHYIIKKLTRLTETVNRLDARRRDDGGQEKTNSEEEDLFEKRRPKKDWEVMTVSYRRTEEGC